MGDLLKVLPAILILMEASFAITAGVLIALKVFGIV